MTTPFHPAQVTRDRLKKAEKLKLVLTAGIGSDHIDLHAAADNNLTVAEVQGRARRIATPAWRRQCGHFQEGATKEPIMAQQRRTQQCLYCEHRYFGGSAQYHSLSEVRSSRPLPGLSL